MDKCSRCFISFPMLEILIISRGNEISCHRAVGPGGGGGVGWGGEGSVV